MAEQKKKQRQMLLTEVIQKEIERKPLQEFQTDYFILITTNEDIDNFVERLNKKIDKQIDKKHISKEEGEQLKELHKQLWVQKHLRIKDKIAVGEDYQKATDSIFKAVFK